MQMKLLSLVAAMGLFATHSASALICKGEQDKVVVQLDTPKYRDLSKIKHKIIDSKVTLDGISQSAFLIYIKYGFGDVLVLTADHMTEISLEKVDKEYFAKEIRYHKEYPSWAETPSLETALEQQDLYNRLLKKAERANLVSIRKMTVHSRNSTKETQASIVLCKDN